MMFELSLHNDATVIDTMNVLGEGGSSSSSSSCVGETMMENQINKKQKTEESRKDNNNRNSNISGTNENDCTTTTTSTTINDNDADTTIYKYFENIQEIIEIQQRMEKFDLLREQVIKECRDIQKWSKQSIFSIHRGNLKEAKTKLQLAYTLALKIADLIKDVSY